MNDAQPTDHYEQLFRMLLKVLGVYLLAVNAVSFVSWVAVYPVLLSLQPLIGQMISDVQLSGWTLQFILVDVLEVAIGLYLLRGGEWLVRLAFPPEGRGFELASAAKPETPAGDPYPDAAVAAQAPSEPRP